MDTVDSNSTETWQFPRIALEDLSRDELKDMLEAGRDVLECHRVLKKTNDNIVGELLRDAGTFYQWQHYPKGDVFGPGQSQSVLLSRAPEGTTPRRTRSFPYIPACIRHEERC